MNKRHLHHLWTKIRVIKPWYFLLAALIWGVLALFGLYSNNKQMVVLRDAVIAADKSGVGVEEALQDLQLHVTRHMNTDLASGSNGVRPPIQLRYTYERLVKTRSDEVAKANADQFAEAQASCRTGGTSVQAGRNELACVTNYMQTKHNISPQPVPDALYKFDFASPKWSPDLAGWSLVMLVLSGALFVVTLLTRLWFKRNV